MGGTQAVPDGGVVVGAQRGDAGPMVAALEAVGFSVLAVVPVAADLVRAVADAVVVLVDHGVDGNPVRAIDDLAGRGRAVVFRVPIDHEVLFFAAVAAGARGVVDTASPMDALARAVQVVAAGEVAMPRGAQGALLDRLRALGAPVTVTIDGREATLTHREWEVLLLLLQERSTAEIARRQYVSQVTVRTHVASLLHKLGLPDRDALVAAVLSPGQAPRPQRTRFTA